MITVNASSTNDPNNSVDHEINLNGGDTIPVNVQLYAGASDSNDVSANFSFSWHLLKRPTSSSAVLDNALIEQPTLNTVDVWGDYRLFCIATNISSGDTSELDPIKAPNSCFVQIRVRSTHKALVKPASGERDWMGYAYEWVDAIESYDPLLDDHETRITTLEASSASETFTNLTDTTFVSLVDGQVPAYNSSTAQWENVTLSGSGASTLLLADTNTDFSLIMASQRLSIKGSSNVTVDASSVGGGLDFVLDLDSTVAISDTLSVGGALTAQDEINAQASVNILQDAYVTGNIKDSVSPYAYLTGKTDGWYMSDDGQAGSECKLMTKCDVPSSASRGGVLASTDKWSSHNTSGKIPSVHILTYSQQANHTIYTNSVEDVGIDVMDDQIDATQSGGTAVTNHCHVLFHNSTGGDISLETIDSCVLTGGFHDGQPYIFELVVFPTTADLLSNNATNSGITVTHTQNSAWKPSVGQLNTGSSIATIVADAYFGMRCTQSAKIAGHRYISNITAIRLI